MESFCNVIPRYNTVVVVPRHSVVGLAVRYFVRSAFTFGILYLVFRALGDDMYARGGWLFIFIGYATILLIHFERLMLDLRQLKELRETLSRGEDPEALVPRWIRREVIRERIISIPIVLVGIAILAGLLKFPNFDVPAWVGGVCIGLAIAHIIIPKRTSQNMPDVKALVKHVIPPDFKQS